MQKIPSKIEFISMLEKGYTNEQLSAHYNCGISTIKRYKKDNDLVGYKTNAKPLTTAQIVAVTSLAEQGLSLQQISTKIGKSDYVLKKYLPDTLYSQIITNSRNVFSSNLIKADITPIFTASKHSAYICGVLQSDGYLTSDGYIGLTAKDRDFVEQFAKFFKTGVRETVQNGNTYFGCRFKDVRNLEKFKSITNIYPQKTYSSYNIPTWISTNEEYMHYFIAGVFDGDGWVSKVSGRRDTLEIGIEQHAASAKFLRRINEYLEWNVYETDSTFRIHTKGKQAVRDFYSWYSQVDYIMLRKVSVFDSVYL